MPTTVIDELDHLGPKLGAKSWVKHYAAENHAGFRSAAAKHPESRQIAELGWNTYLEEQTSDAARE